MKPFHRLSLLALACLFWTAAVRADAPASPDQWTLTAADFTSQPVTLTSIDSAAVHVVPVGQTEARALNFDYFLDIERLGNTPAMPTGMVIRLAGGDVLGGGPVSLKGDSLLWNSPTVGQVMLSMKLVRSISLPSVTLGTDRPVQDVVSLANGDSVRGTVTDLDGKTVTVTTDTDTVPVPLASVRSIVLAASGGTPPASRGFRVRLDDGTSVTVSDLSLTGASLKMTFAKGQTQSIDLQHVIAIEQVNGPVSWLSQRPPSANVYTPLMGTAQKYVAQMDSTVTGDPLHFGAEEFAHGIGVHSYSRLAWPLDGSYAAFRTQFAIDGDRPLADVTVRIKLDDKVVYEQSHVRSGVLWPIVTENLGNAKLLTLEVDYGDNLDAQDHLNWLSPALLKTAPPPPPPAPVPSIPLVVPATEPATQPAPATQP
jgi:NPCBM/NEW2 domain